MQSGRYVFSQVMDLMSVREFRRCVRRYRGDYRTKKFSCLDQLRCMAFAQLTGRESLRDIESCLRSLQPKLYHVGIRSRVSRSTLADANERRDWRIYRDFAQCLIATAKGLYAGEDLGLELDDTAYALDSTTIRLSLSLFPWATYCTHDAAVKLHTLMNLRGSIPEFILISKQKTHDVSVLDSIIPEPGSYYVMDRGYLHFARLYRLDKARAFFVIRARRNLQMQRRSSRPVDKSTGLRSDQTVVPSGVHSAKTYPQPIRRVRFYDAEQRRSLIFLTNSFALPALTIAELYRARWRIELFFRWIKQHLRIKAFYGNSDNAVRTQIWIAVCVYLMVAILKKRHALSPSLHTILQVLGLTLFEKTPVSQLFTTPKLQDLEDRIPNQLSLFE